MLSYPLSGVVHPFCTTPVYSAIISLGRGNDPIRNQFSVLSLFTAGVNGVWYDPSDITTLYRDAAGTTPVTAVEQPVGLMLDKSKGLVLGSEIIVDQANRDFSSDTGWWSKEAGVSISNGTANWTASLNNNSLYRFNVLTVGLYYEVTFTVTSISSGGIRVYTPSGSSQIAVTTGTYTVRICAVNATLGFTSVGTTTASIDNVSVKQVIGNHAFNSSGNSANFPVLSARYNLLTKTEQFDDAAWTNNNKVTANTHTAPNGMLSADTVTSDGTTNNVSQSISAFSGVQYKLSVSLKYTNNRWVLLQLSDVGTTHRARAWFDVLNGVKGTSAVTGSGVVVDYTITPEGDGWYRCTLVATNPITTLYAYFPTLVTADGVTTVAANGQSVAAWGADLRVTNDALNQPAYQRVNTSTDYDTVGFKPAEVFDGVDDNLIASAGGGSTTAFFWCSAIRVGKVGAVQTLFSDAGTNTGYRVRINASNQLELSAGNGTAYTTVATTATLSIGQRAVLTAWHDGTNLSVQINNGTIHQTAFATATAGTAQFTIGKDNNAASNFFAGRLYEKIYTKDNVPSAAQITSTKTYVANVAGITLS